MNKEQTPQAASNRAPNWLITFWRAINIPLGAVFLALLIGAIVLLVSGANPITAYTALFQASLGSLTAFGRTLEKATPLVFSALAVAFAFKAGLFNIGAQGQLLLGALVAAIVGVYARGLPAVIHIPLALLCGGLAGALYGAIPGALKAYTGAHEVITTIMLNYIAINLTDYLADGPLKDPDPANVIARTAEIMETAKIPVVAGIPLGFFIAGGIAVLIWWLLQKTTFGYEIRTVGFNPHAARYAGMKVARTVIGTMMVSGFLAGLGGAVETMGVVGRYQPGFNVGLGFDGITVALLANTNPFGVIPASILVGAMKAGSAQMQVSAHVAKEIVDVILALILFFISAEKIVRWVFRSKAPPKELPTLTTGWSKQ
jgi:general nucleoside transport system permease protein